METAVIAPDTNVIGTDWESSLRSTMVAAGHSAGSTPEPTPAEAEPSPAPAVEAVPEAPPEGTTPPPTDSPADAQGLTLDKLVQKYGSPEGVVKAFEETQQRAIEAAKALKAAPAVAPAVPAAPPEPVVAPEPVPVPAEEVNRLIQGNDRMQALRAEFDGNATTIETRQTEIQTLKNQIHDEDVILGRANVDEITKEEARLNRAALREKLQDASDELNTLTVRNMALQNSWKNGKARIEAHVRGQLGERAREAQAEKALDADAQTFTETIYKTFDAEMVAQKIPPELRADMLEAVKVRALAHPMQPDISAAVKGWLEKSYAVVDKYHRLQSKQHALKAHADTAPTAPAGQVPGSFVPPANQPMDYETKLRMEMRRAGRR